MKKSSLETIVLILGIGIIGFALFMYMIAKPSGESAFYTNIVFAFGFLIYIVYSMMATKNLNSEIRNLGNHVKSLKDTVKDKSTEIESLESTKTELTHEVGSLNKSLSESQEIISGLNGKIKDLEEERSSSSDKETEL